jgi:cell division protein FtsW (lipid II flippase)
MELFDNLASVGFTTRVLQFIIVAGIIIFLIGLYWRYIVVGAGILFCVVVFAMPTSKPIEVAKVEQKVETPEVKQIEPLPPVDEVKPETKEQSDERMFLEDCQSQTKYTQAQCKALWNEHKDEIEAVKYRGKNNKYYMKKVKYGI